jgi:hypothetical protein
MRRALWINFAVSVWVLIGFSALQSAAFVMRRAEIMDSWGPFAGRVIAAPLVYLCIELLLWWRPFRERERGARLMAGFMGVMLLMKPVFTSLIVSDLYGYTMQWGEFSVFLYVSLSHLAFAVFGSEY